MSASELMAHPRLLKRRDNFSQISNELIRNDKLSDSARMLLIYLCSFINMPNHKFYDHIIMKNLGYGRQKLYKLFAELRKFGYMKKFTNPQNEKGQFMGSKRVFSDEPVFLDDESASTEVMKIITSENKTLEPEVMKTEVLKISTCIKNTNIKNTNNNSNCSNNIESDLIVTDGDALSENKVVKLKNKDRPTKEQIEAAFKRYWKLYPKKQGKSDALKYFTSLLAPLPVAEAKKLSEEIYAGLVAYVTEGQILRKIKADNPTWKVDYPDWKHGNFWLTAKRWLDIDGYQTNYDEVYANAAIQNAHKQPGNQPRSGTAQQYEEAFAVFERPIIPAGASPTCFV